MIKIVNSCATVSVQFPPGGVQVQEVLPGPLRDVESRVHRQQEQLPPPRRVSAGRMQGQAAEAQVGVQRVRVGVGPFGQPFNYKHGTLITQLGTVHV